MCEEATLAWYINNNNNTYMLTSVHVLAREARDEM